MPDYTQTYLDTVTKSQEVAFDAATAWADYVQATWDSALAKTKSQPQIPNPVELVTSTFDNADKLLGLQRDFYTGIAAAYAPLVEQVAADAKPAKAPSTAKS